MRANISDVGGRASMIFAPFINIYSVIAGSGKLEAVGSTHENGMDIDLTTQDPNATSNVYTCIGTLYLYLGPWGSALYVAISGLVSYVILLSLRSPSSAWFLALYSFLCAQLVFGFFEFYFWHLTAIEVPAYCTFLFLLSRVSEFRTRQQLRAQSN
jgi:hypothetical protein